MMRRFPMRLRLRTLIVVVAVLALEFRLVAARMSNRLDFADGYDWAECLLQVLLLNALVLGPLSIAPGFHRPASADAGDVRAPRRSRGVGPTLTGGPPC